MLLLVYVTLYVKNVMPAMIEKVRVTVFFTCFDSFSYQELLRI